MNDLLNRQYRLLIDKLDAANDALQDIVDLIVIDGPAPKTLRRIEAIKPDLTEIRTLSEDVEQRMQAGGNRLITGETARLAGEHLEAERRLKCLQLMLSDLIGNQERKPPHRSPGTRRARLRLIRTT